MIKLSERELQELRNSHCIPALAVECIEQLEAENAKLRADRDSWRRVSKRLGNEKQELRTQVESPKKADQLSKAEIVNGQLIVSIGLNKIKKSVEHGTDLIIDNIDKAAQAIKNQIKSESENGTTIFLSMLDKAALDAAENGEYGFEI